MLMLIFLAKIFFGILVKGFFAPKRTKVISLPFVFGRAGGSGRVDVHMADGVVNCIGHG